MNQPKKISSAYEAGKDCTINGANTENCNFKWFATPELLAEWERGKREASNV